MPKAILCGENHLYSASLLNAVDPCIKKDFLFSTNLALSGLYFLSNTDNTKVNIFKSARVVWKFKSHLFSVILELLSAQVTSGNRTYKPTVLGEV